MQINKNGMNINIIFLVLFICMNSFAADEAILRGFGSGFGQFSTTSFVILAVVLVVGIFLLVFTEIRRVQKITIQKNKMGWVKYDAVVESKNFKENDEEYFKNMLESVQIESADLALTSALVFEKTVETWYKNHHMTDREWDIMYRVRHALGFDSLIEEMPMLSTRHIREQYKVTFVIEGVGTASSNILENNEKEWLIQNTFKGQFAVGQQIQLLVTRQGDGEYLITLPIKKIENDILVMPHTRNMLRKQQRSWVRIDVSYPVKIKLKEITESEDLKNGDVILSRLSDISGGGASVRITQKLKLNDVILLNFDLPKNSLRNIEAKVTRVVDVKTVDGLYVHSLEFINLETQNREKIIRFVFDKQRQDSQWR